MEEILNENAVESEPESDDVNAQWEKNGNPVESTHAEDTQNEKKTFKQYLKSFADRYFIQAFSGMALGLFCTLIIGTIIGQIGSLTLKADEYNGFGMVMNQLGAVAKLLMGAGIGVGIAYSLKAKKLTGFTAAVAGMIGANITNIFAMSGISVYGASKTPSITIGDPVGAFVGAVGAIEIADLVEGKTPVDIIVVPLTAIAAGTVFAICLGIPFGMLFAILGKGVSMAIEWEPVSFGILVSVLMGLLLTFPTSSAAFGVMIFNSSLITEDLFAARDLGAAAACAGCCAHMVGFAVASFRDNGWSGVVSQGIGTSMLQIPNIGKNPRILIPAVAASAVAGPLASAVFKITCDATGSGMGTAGLVGVIETFITSMNNGQPWWYVLIAVLECYIIVPGLIAFGVSELMRKKGWIKKGDMLLK